jgi:UrcA family protein
MHRLFKTVFVATLLASAPFASAAAEPFTASVAVRVADLDLDREQEVRVLLRRIERAADIVCGETVARRYHSTWSIYETCRRATIASTVGQIDSRQLRELHARRFGTLSVEAANH